VVTRGNFKLDSALQIQAKPSMMTPGGGGGGGGHHHGGRGAKPAEEDTASQVKLSFVSKEQLEALIEAYAPLTELIKSGNDNQAKKTLGQIDEALNAVDMSLLSGHTHMVWMEYAMRLQNDLVVAQDTRTGTQLEVAANTLASDMAEMSGKLGLGMHRAGGNMATRLDAPEEFRQQLAGFYAFYLGVVDALASDAFEDARKAASGARTALEAIDMKLLQGDAHMAWMAMVEPLGKTLNTMAKADAIQGVRAEVPALTEALAKAIVAFGLPPGKPAYKAHCPMAFDGAGADWIQSGTKIRNPYYGSMMLECGAIEGRLDAESGAAGHEGHSPAAPGATAPSSSGHEGSHEKDSSHE
jgi:Cu(I)/Ag(I) efflux system membrane fusion protein